MRPRQGVSRTTWRPAKGVRDVFRRAAGTMPDRWDWLGVGHVPSVLTKEMEADQDQKKKVRRKGLKEKMKEREEKEKAAVEEDPEPAPAPVLTGCSICWSAEARREQGHRWDRGSDARNENEDRERATSEGDRGKVKGRQLKTTHAHYLTVIYLIVICVVPSVSFLF
jgi:hypothetical protein